MLRGELVVLDPLDPADAGRLRESHVQPEVAAWWGQPADGFPLTDEPEATRFAIRRDGEMVGMIQYGEESEPEYRHAWIDLFLAPEASDQGLGTDAVGTLVRHLQSVRCYETAGFEHVGITRRSWRDPDGVWHDSLLMELVVEP